jgi:transcriptional regulator with XRE-family HTH domain
MSSARQAFAARLRARRIEQGFGEAKTFSDALNVNSGTYNRWERGETEPNLDTILRICVLLETDPNFLLAGKVKT